MSEYDPRGLPTEEALRRLRSELIELLEGVTASVTVGTSDANKPVSTAQQTALNLKANLASPTFTGTVSGISATMVGLGNVSNAAAIPAADLDTTSTLGTDDTKVPSQKAVKTYVDSELASSGTSKWTSGWVNTDGSTTAANGATMTFTHNLGTEDFVFECYSADDVSGTNKQKVSSADIWSSGHHGATVTGISTTQVTVQLASHGWFEWSSTGTAVATSWSGHYMKVVLIG